MIALLQRVTTASVTVAGNTIAHIDQGLLVLIGVEKHDSPENITKLADKILKYRVFSDESGKMNLSLCDIRGQLLLVPQFTLAADTRKGLRPSFSSAASPQQGYDLFHQLVDIMHENVRTANIPMAGNWLQTGEFGADMAVALVNDGPVTFQLAV